MKFLVFRKYKDIPNTYVDLSLLVFLAIMAIFNFPSVAIAIAVFGFIWLHEIGHVREAHKLGYPCKEITLYIVGGAAFIPLCPSDYKSELKVGWAGPWVSLQLAGIFAILGGLAEWIFPLIAPGFYVACFLNAMIVGFNLLPVIPMDGGRILRGSLGYWGFDLMQRNKAMLRISLVVGCIACITFFIYQLYFTSLLLVLVLVISFMEYRFVNDYYEQLKLLLLTHTVEYGNPPSLDELEHIERTLAKNMLE